MTTHAILGCMFAGKSKLLLQKYRERRIAGAACVLIAHKLDERYGTGAVRTHDGDCESAHITASLMSPSTAAAILGADDVFVDEGSFYNDLLQFADTCATAGINLYVCGLDLTFDLQPFGSMLDLAARPGAHVYYPRGPCACGQPAIYTKRRDDIHAGTVLVGGSDIYSAVCAACHRGRSPCDPDTCRLESNAAAARIELIDSKREE